MLSTTSLSPVHMFSSFVFHHLLTPDDAELWSARTMGAHEAALAAAQEQEHLAAESAGPAGPHTNARPYTAAAALSTGTGSNTAAAPQLPARPTTAFDVGSPSPSPRRSSVRSLGPSQGGQPPSKRVSLAGIGGASSVGGVGGVQGGDKVQGGTRSQSRLTVTILDAAEGSSSGGAGGLRPERSSTGSIAAAPSRTGSTGSTSQAVSQPVSQPGAVTGEQPPHPHNNHVTHQVLETQQDPIEDKVKLQTWDMVGQEALQGQQYSANIVASSRVACAALSYEDYRAVVDNVTASETFESLKVRLAVRCKIFRFCCWTFRSFCSWV